MKLRTLLQPHKKKNKHKPSPAVYGEPLTFNLPGDHSRVTAQLAGQGVEATDPASRHGAHRVYYGAGRFTLEFCGRRHRHRELQSTLGQEGRQRIQAGCLLRGQFWQWPKRKKLVLEWTWTYKLKAAGNDL